MIATRDYQNHSIRTDDWRYMRYADGSAELYDRTADLLEWRNLAEDSRYDDVKAELARILPGMNVPSVPKPNNMLDD